ncbi:hypothetical protein BGX31_007621 [Mortierella sp. GBA43]|nr:hypothetical protein BGX31_007621 [Mortierella sp. GBA43]
MKFFTTLAVTLSVFAVATSAVPTAGAPSHEMSRQHHSTTEGSTVTASTLLKKRRLSNGNTDHVNSIIDGIVTIHGKVVVKALAKLKVDVCADVHARVKATTTGLLPAHADVDIPTLTARVKADADAAINAKIEKDGREEVLKKVRKHAHHVIGKHCPRQEDQCLYKKAESIVGDIEALVKLDVEHLFIALKANLMVHVRSQVDITVRDLSVNLLVEQINVQAKVDGVVKVNADLDVCAHVIVKGLQIALFPGAVSTIRSLCA